MAGISFFILPKYKLGDSTSHAMPRIDRLSGLCSNPFLFGCLYVHPTSTVTYQHLRHHCIASEVPGSMCLTYDIKIAPGIPIML